MLRRLHHLRLAGALMLLLSLALPMSSCTVPVGEPGAPADAPPTGTHTAYQWAWSGADPANLVTWVVISAFVWPVAALGIRGRLRRRAARLALAVAEPLLLTGTGFVLQLLLIFGDPEPGFFLAAAGIALFGIGWLADTTLMVRGWRRSAAPQPG